MNKKPCYTSFKGSPAWQGRSVFLIIYDNPKGVKIMTEHITWHPFEMQFRKPENAPSGSNTATQTEEIVYTRKFQAPKRLLILGCGYVAPVTVPICFPA